MQRQLGVERCEEEAVRLVRGGGGTESGLLKDWFN